MPEHGFLIAAVIPPDMTPETFAKFIQTAIETELYADAEVTYMGELEDEDDE